jgi:hypothetical protein
MTADFKAGARPKLRGRPKLRISRDPNFSCASVAAILLLTNARRLFCFFTNGR